MLPLDARREDPRGALGQVLDRDPERVAAPREPRLLHEERRRIISGRIFQDVIYKGAVYKGALH